MIVLTAYYHCKPGTVDTVLAALREMVAAIKRSEPGCPLFLVSQSHDDPNRLLLYEHYVDQDALTAHRDAPHYKQFVEGIILPLLETRERALYDLVIE